MGPGSLSQKALFLRLTSDRVFWALGIVRAGAGGWGGGFGASAGKVVAVEARDVDCAEGEENECERGSPPASVSHLWTPGTWDRQTHVGNSAVGNG